ncbi:MAG: glycoside hydrolase family 71/99-like protein [Ferruginibacter sp.]
MIHCKKYFFILSLCVLVTACSKKNGGNGTENPPVEPPDNGYVYDTTGLLYKSYTNLVMAGYQGWFAADGDESQRGWYHYQGPGGVFAPGTTNVDFWPDITEYTKKYKSPFKFSDGSDAYLYSPYDEESVDLHFKWMKDYGIDGVHMQRFLGEVKPTNAKGKRHFNKVLANALKAAKKYGRAISVMYDLSGSSSAEINSYLEADWKELQTLFKLSDNKENPTYLYHNGKPLVTIWGVGFNDSRNYTMSDVSKFVDKIKGDDNRYSVMLGVPYYWRTGGGDTRVSDTAALHALIRKCDVVMPWAVGRYGASNYNFMNVYNDVQWCKKNKVSYVPLVFPGFTWGNMHKDPSKYDEIPRQKGNFLWQQIGGAKEAGAQALYVAMFDEIDEGTAIYKTALQKNTPLNGGGGFRFVGIEDDLTSDYYLWLTGQGTNWFHGQAGYSRSKPVR